MYSYFLEVLFGQISYSSLNEPILGHFALSQNTQTFLFLFS